MGLNIVQKIVLIDYRLHLIFAFVIRVALIWYGVYHDSISTVSYTDVDYKVFTDASRHILNSSTPYNRHTYRYTPLIAIALIPNIILHECFGKIMFSLMDLVVGVLIFLLVKHNISEFKRYVFKIKASSSKSLQYKNEKSDVRVQLSRAPNIAMLIWLYNPMTVAIATRGNCDSVAGFLVLLTLYAFECKKFYFISGIVLGLAIHVRLYPLAYSVALFMSLSNFSSYSFFNKKNDSMATPKRAISLHRKGMTVFVWLMPNYNQIKLIFGCVLSLTITTSTFYYLYGHQFLYESYIYHLIRKDTRHNFSLYFYLQYLTGDITVLVWQKVLTILPQAILLIVFSIYYGLNQLSLNFGIVVQTITLVTYNTVVTSQYYVWILAVLPLCLWQIKLTKRATIMLSFVWTSAQLLWLLPAFLLEFKGKNTFWFIWIQSVSVFCANIVVLGKLVQNFMPVEYECKL